MAWNQYDHMKFPDYVYQEFPKWLYRKGGESKLIQTKEEEAVLLRQGGWFESLAKAEASREPDGKGKTKE